MKGLKNKVVMVSGGSRGIGKAIVLQLLTLGVKVAFSFQNRTDAADAFIKELEPTLQESVMAVQADVSKSASVQDFIHTTIEKFGQVDGLVCNAGIVRSMPAMFMSDANWHDVLNTNLDGTFYLCRGLLQHWLKLKQKGRIVNISSAVVYKSFSGQANYAASKAGIIALSRSLAKESAAYGIQVNVVAPGLIETDMVKQTPVKILQQFKEEIPMGRLGAVEDVAEVVCFLLSDATSYITGTVVTVDGGFAL